MSQVHTSHYAIAEFWMGKFISPDGSVTDMLDENSRIVIDDFGEPCCWACGKLIVGDYEKRMRDVELLDNIDFQKLWNDKKVRSKLDRCHIVPQQFNGKDEPNNLFLMCHQCHSESPDTRKQKSFLRWVYDRKNNYEMGEIRPTVLLCKTNEELIRRGVGSLEQILSVLQYKQSDIDFKDMKKYVIEHAGVHVNSCVISTRVNVLADYIQNKLMEVTLDS